jgi:clan AA aspartic protease
MGKVMVTARLTNEHDQVLAARGFKRPNEVRSIEVQGLVDTGATLRVLPEDKVKELGLEIVREIPVTFADGRREMRPIARTVFIEIMGRDAVVDCVVEKSGTQILIGQVPLEVMDLVVDPKNAHLGPRPESPDTPMYEIY